MDSELIKRQLKEIEARMEHLLHDKKHIMYKLEEALSLEYIKEKNITRQQVELSTGEEKPWFGLVSSFADWLKTYSDRPYCEWNGRIY